MTTLLVASLVALAAAALVLCGLLGSRFRALALDHPNERSLHSRVVPRTGGIAVLVAAAVALAFTSEASCLLVLGLALGGLSFLDDRRGLPVAVRLLAQLIAAAVAILHINPEMPLLWCFLWALAVVWMTNLYNFMDGSDGLAGGMGVVGFAAYAIAACTHGAFGLALSCACIAVGCATFLTRNYPPARIFMGDVGSTVLGFWAASLGARGCSTGLWQLWFPALVFLPFILDASITLGKRARRGERIWEAHREHYYQRLIRSGWTHRRMAQVAHLLMLACAGSAILLLDRATWTGWLGLLANGAVLGGGMWLVDARWARHLAHDPSPDVVNASKGQ